MSSAFYISALRNNITVICEEVEDDHDNKHSIPEIIRLLDNNSLTNQPI